MRWADLRAGLVGGLAEIRRQPHLAVPAALATLALVLLPVQLVGTYYAFALAEPEFFLIDYSFFHEAALRFFSDPATLYAEPEYFYPPPAVLAFWPTTLVGKVTGYLLSGPLIFAQFVVAALWSLRLWERETGEALGTTTRVALAVIVLGSSPTFQNLKYAQVNGLVLLSALGFLALCQRGRPGWGALALAGGFWIKLLPLALLPLGLGKRWSRLAVGTLAGFVALPLVLLPLVPGSLYAEYALVRFPEFSGLTNWSPLNGSIQGTIARLHLPVDIVLTTGMLPATPLASALAAMVGVLVVASATLAAWTRRIGTVRAGAVVLGVLPAVVPLGWEHTYALTLPLLAVALLSARRQPAVVKGLVAICALAFIAQRLPTPWMAALIETVPRGLIDLYLARFWMATLVLIGVALTPAIRTLRPHAPAPA